MQQQQIMPCMYDARVLFACLSFLILKVKNDMESKNCCGNCLNFIKISKQYGLCMITKSDILNANNGGLNQVYMRVAKYNVCKGHFNLKK